MNNLESNNNLIQRLTKKFTAGEARYIMRCLEEDLVREQYNNGDKHVLLTQAVDEILKGKPLQYVTGIAWFFKMKFHVNPDVLIPRPETEELVEWVLESYDDTTLNVLDIGTGSGCIGVALKRMRSDWDVSACDVSENALAIAQQNAKENKADIHFFKCDISNPNVDFTTRFNVIVSNPPYIAMDEASTLDKNVIRHEPHLALFAPENDPLFFYDAIVRFALNHLQPNGSVFVEINQQKAAETMNRFVPYFRYVEMRRDLSGNFRMLYANGLKEEPPTR